MSKARCSTLLWFFVAFNLVARNSAEKDDPSLLLDKECNHLPGVLEMCVDEVLTKQANIAGKEFPDINEEPHASEDQETFEGIFDCLVDLVPLEEIKTICAGGKGVEKIVQCARMSEEKSKEDTPEAQKNKDVMYENYQECLQEKLKTMKDVKP